MDINIYIYIYKIIYIYIFIIIFFYALYLFVRIDSFRFDALVLSHTKRFDESIQRNGSAETDSGARR